MIIAVATAFGGLEALKWWTTRRSARQSAVAEADHSQTDAFAARERLYEDTITFLQAQLRDKEERFAALTDRLHAAMEAELDLTRRLGEMELRYLSSRCDAYDCPRRRPPLPGKNANDCE